MVAGMGWLLGRCPPPEEIVLAELCKPFGILPSQVKSQDDWEFLVSYASLRNLQGNYQAWNQMVANPESEESMDMDLIQGMLELMEEAKAKWPTRKSRSS